MTPNRHFNPRTGRWTQPDPFWGIHNMQNGPNAIMQASNLYMFTMHNPVRWIDPLGLAALSAQQQSNIASVKRAFEWGLVTREQKLFHIAYNTPGASSTVTQSGNWIFYCANYFRNQAVAQANRWGGATLVSVNSHSEFYAGWNRMVNAGPANNVALIFHGTQFIVQFGNRRDGFEFLTTSNQKQTATGLEAFYIGNLRTATMRYLYVMTCNGGHLDFIYSNTHYRAKGFNHNVAVSFLVNNNVTTVHAWDGALVSNRINLSNYF